MADPSCRVEVATAMSTDVNDLASKFMSWVTQQGADSARPKIITQATRPWDTWELDEGFFRALSQWTLDNPETSLDRVLVNIHDGLENSKDLLSLIPESPFPARGLVTALGYLLRLGISIRRAQRDVQEFAKDFVQWVGRVKSAFESAEDGGFARQAWRDLRHMRELVDKMCLWAVDRLNDGRWLRIGHGLTIQKEIFEFKERISNSRALFQDLSAINMARGLDAIIQKLRTLLSNQQTIITEIREVRKTQKKQLDRIVNELELQKQVAERERFFAKTLNVHAIASPTYDSQGKRPCDEDTRMEVLDDIRKWRSNIKRGSPNFLWLTGDPGCGKSAITASFAQDCKDEGTLWAQFFINRNNAETTDPRAFFPSIARQLADYSPEVAQAIHLTLVKQRSLTDDISTEQAAHLFTHTIRIASQLDPDRPVVVVIDGLDETDRKELKRTAAIFSTLFTTLESYSNVKVFVSSRTENDIQKSFVLAPNDRHVKRVHLDTANPSSIRDVSHYVTRNLLDLVKEHDLNWEVWPGDARSRTLGERASGLFIWAVTAIKFIQDQLDLHGKERLNAVLNLLTAEVLHDVNALYTLILTITLGQHQNGSDTWEFERFRRIIGAIVCLQEPLCLDDLGLLLDLRETPSSDLVDIIHFVRRFRTILVTGTAAINGSTIPRIHKSVYEFLTSAIVDRQFRVDPNHAHLELAMQCLAWLHVSQWIDVEVFPASLQYACRFWSSHLSQAGIAGSVARCADYTQTLTTSPHSIPRSYLISDKPVRIRHSTLKSKIQVKSKDAFRIWDAITGLSRSHMQDVLGVVPSPDGKDLVSWSDDYTIRVWDSRNAELRRTLVDYPSRCTALAISPNGKSIVSGFNDGMVCLWVYSLGTQIWKLFFQEPVTCVAFSPSGNWIISGCDDHTCRTMDALTGNIIGKPGGKIVDIAFSADGQRACSLSSPAHLVIWEVSTGEQIHSWNPAHTSSLRMKVSFWPNDPDFIVVHTGSGRIKIESAKESRSIPNSRKSHCFSLSSDGQEIIFGNQHSISVKEFDLKDKTNPSTVRGMELPLNRSIGRLRAFSPNWDLAYSTYQNTIHTFNLQHHENPIIVDEDPADVFEVDYERLLDALCDMKSGHKPYTTTNNQRLDTTRWYELVDNAKSGFRLCMMTDKCLVAGHEDGSVSIWELNNSHTSN